MRDTQSTQQGKAPFLAALAIGVLVAGLSLAWTITTFGGIVSLGALFDGLIAGYLALVFLSFQRKLKLGICLAGLFILVLHLAALAKYVVLQTGVEVSDLLLVDDLMIHYVTSGDWIWLVPLLLLLAVLALAFANLRAPNRGERILMFPVLGYLCLIGGKLFLSEGLASSLPLASNSHFWMPAEIAIGHWGAFFRSGIVYAEREERFNRLQADNTPEFGFIDATLDPRQRRNVHIVVLESLIDPLSIKGASYSQDPFSPMFQRWRASNGAVAVQPVFGGRSPDGVFELLCGLPAILDDGQVILAILEQERVDCLPSKLRELGYRTETWVPTPPAEFNYQVGYRQLGFETLRFAPDVDMADRDGETLSAQSLLRQNLAHLRETLRPGQPLLNYVFVTAGHFPYALDRARRPYQVTVSPDNDVLAAYVNCAYYTTRAVESYIEELRRLDPDGIIVMVGDHPPGLPTLPNSIKYPRPIETRFDVPLLVVDGVRGEVRPPSPLPAYHIPALVTDLLTDGAFCGGNACPHRGNIAVRPLRTNLLVFDRTGTTVSDCMTGTRSGCAEARRFADSAKLALYRLVGMR